MHISQEWLLDGGSGEERLKFDPPSSAICIAKCLPRIYEYFQYDPHLLHIMKIGEWKKNARVAVAVPTLNQISHKDNVNR